MIDCNIGWESPRGTTGESNICDWRIPSTMAPVQWGTVKARNVQLIMCRISTCVAILENNNSEHFCECSTQLYDWLHVGRVQVLHGGWKRTMPLRKKSAITLAHCITASTNDCTCIPFWNCANCAIGLHYCWCTVEAKGVAYRNASKSTGYHIHRSQTSRAIN